ncbi:hypothetical protein L2E82_28386 [Cichorium intybus]|uniref:Uncharacterized protein n=1 Tax=Cichorium intybus TaxID=13427 RepID=A0ACB9CW93_CICIN|nr:hypothetical protein L2E82_28386 [Cichorium intybus]
MPNSSQPFAAKSSAFEIKKTFVQKSGRVKSVDLHPTEPWVLLGLYSGNVAIWNFSSQVTEKTFETGKSPVRTAIFIAHKEWIVVGADDGFIRVYNYKNCTIKMWNLGSSSPCSSIECHSKGLNSVEFFDSNNKLYFITGSDDYTAKVWDYETETCVQTLEDSSQVILGCDEGILVAQVIHARS